MSLEEFTQKLNKETKDRPLAGAEKYVISQHADSAIQNGSSNYPMSNLALYLDAKGCRIDIIDLLFQHYPIRSVDDAHAVIEKLLDLYKCKISPMNDAIGCIYTHPTKNQSSLSIKTFLAVMDYFKCDVKIKEND